jgi:NAD(P)-dependent dehydrogenase (short-subunit alcohol dehydrogenase family)
VNPAPNTRTTDEVLDGVDLTGRRVLVTGASAGLGVETVRALTAHGAQVVAAVRDPAKARQRLSDAGVRSDRVALRPVDLASLASVRAATETLRHDGLRFDLVVANAGIMACPFGLTADGFELQFGTNHLGHFALVTGLAPAIVDGGRVVVLSSSGHRHSDVDLVDPGFRTRPYHPWVAYGRSKTANALFALEFDRRHRERGVRAAAVHPGAIATELNRHLNTETITLLRSAPGRRARIPIRSVAEGAATTVWAAIADGEVVGGRYCEDCAPSPVVADQAVTPGVMAYAADPGRAGALWDLSEALVGRPQLNADSSGAT